MTRSVLLALLLAGAASAADTAVVQPNGSVVVTITLTAQEAKQAEIALDGVTFEEHADAPKTLAEAFARWLRERIQHHLDRAREIRRQRQAEPASLDEEVAATRRLLRGGR